MAKKTSFSIQARKAGKSVKAKAEADEGKLPEADATIAEAAEVAYALQERYRAASRVADEIETEFNAAKDKVLLLLQQAKLDGARSKSGSFSISKKELPVVDDWVKLYKWVIQKKHPEIFQRRISTEFWSDLLKDGVTIPGTSKFTKVSLSMRSK